MGDKHFTILTAKDLGYAGAEIFDDKWHLGWNVFVASEHLKLGEIAGVLSKVFEVGAKYWENHCWTCGILNCSGWEDEAKCF